jgi:hypothetical protein
MWIMSTSKHRSVKAFIEISWKKNSLSWNFGVYAVRIVAAVLLKFTCLHFHLFMYPIKVQHETWQGMLGRWWEGSQKKVGSAGSSNY